MLPITGGHLYLGYRPEYVKKNYQEIVSQQRRAPRVWQDIIWEFLATGDPDAALAQISGEQHVRRRRRVRAKAHTFHWIRNLAALGLVDTSVTANNPLAVDLRQERRAHLRRGECQATPLTVTFSTGTT